MPFEKKKKVGGGNHIVRDLDRKIVFCEAEKLSIIELILKDEEKKL